MDLIRNNEMKAAGDEPYSSDRPAHLEVVRPSTVPLDDPWAAFWERLAVLFEGMDPEGVNGP